MTCTESQRRRSSLTVLGFLITRVLHEENRQQAMSHVATNLVHRYAVRLSGRRRIDNCPASSSSLASTDSPILISLQHLVSSALRPSVLNPPLSFDCSSQDPQRSNVAMVRSGISNQG